MGTLTIGIVIELKEKLGQMGSIHFSVKVRPKAAQTEFKGLLADGTLKVDLCAVPEDGKANEELIRFLAKHFNVPKSNIEILSGQTSKKKRIRISQYSNP